MFLQVLKHFLFLNCLFTEKQIRLCGKLIHRHSHLQAVVLIQTMYSSFAYKKICSTKQIKEYFQRFEVIMGKQSGGVPTLIISSRAKTDEGRALSEYGCENREATGLQKYCIYEI